jgi:hypothetical protein
MGHVHHTIHVGKDKQVHESEPCFRVFHYAGIVNLAEYLGKQGIYLLSKSQSGPPGCTGTVSAPDGVREAFLPQRATLAL